MIEIDGSQGEGGGQIIRSSVALSAVIGQPIKLTNIRAKRSKPGLRQQHLTAVHAAARVCNARVEGAEIDAREITFEPNEICGGHYRFSVGTAGSTSLVAQTVLPALMLADSPSVVTFEGGTHNPWAPPFDFLQRSYLPQLEKFGPQVSATLDSYGFFPAGSGRFQIKVAPSKLLRGFQLLERGDALGPRVTSIVSQLPVSIAQRELDTIRRKSNWRPDCFRIVEDEDPRGPGNVAMIELPFANVNEIMIGFGKQGVKAEKVASDVYREAKAYLETAAPVGEYLADQLLMPMGLAASQGHTSEMRCTPLSFHSRTQIDVLKLFLEIDIEVEEAKNDAYVKVKPAS